MAFFTVSSKSFSRALDSSNRRRRFWLNVGVRHDRRVQGEPARSAKILPWSHVLFSNLKSWLRGTFHGVSKKHMQRYLDEFSYRFNQRWEERTLFGSILGRALVSSPFPYTRLVAESRG
jgi:transposase-like protein